MDKREQIFNVYRENGIDPQKVIDDYCLLYMQMIGVNNLTEAAERLSERKDESKYIESINRRKNIFEWVCKQDFCFFGLQEYDKKMSKALHKAIEDNNMDDKIGVIEELSIKPDVAILYNKNWEPEGDVQPYGKKKQFAIAETFTKGDVSVRVLSVHLQSGAGKRGIRAKQVKQLEEEFRHDNLIICMDANDTSGDKFILEDLNSGTDAAISTGSVGDIENCMPNDSCLSDHFVAKVTVDDNENFRSLECEFIGNKGGVSEVSTIKCRGPESEQLNKIGEWVKGTIDFILAKGSLSGVKVLSWNLLNKIDIFVKPGDSFNMDAVKAAKKYINRLHKKKLKNKKEQLGGIDRHWEQEIIKAAHEELLKLKTYNDRAAQMAERVKKDVGKKTTEILKRKKKTRRRRLNFPLLRL